MALNFLNDGYFAGKVGIGTETLSTKLTVSGQQELLQLTRGGASDSKWFFSADSARLYIAEDTSATANIKLTIVDDGNVGIGVSPSSWQTISNSNALQFYGSYVYNYRDTNLIIGNNAYYDGTWKYYKSSIGATKFNSGNGAFDFAVSSSGNADNAITWIDALVIANDGNATFAGALDVTGSTTLSGLSATSLTTPLVQLQGDITILNKAQTSYISFATRDTSGSDTIMDLTNVTINGGAEGPYLPLAGGIMTGPIESATALQINAASFIVKNAAGDENMLSAFENGAVNLYYDGGTGVGPKLSTTSLGVSITGTVNGTLLRVKATDGNTTSPSFGFASVTNTGMYLPSSSTLAFVAVGSQILTLNGTDDSIKFDGYDSTNNVGTPTYILGTDASGNVVKVLGGDIPGGGGGTVTGTGVTGEVAYWTSSTNIANNAGMSFSNEQVQFDGIGGSDGFAVTL